MKIKELKPKMMYGYTELSIICDKSSCDEIMNIYNNATIDHKKEYEVIIRPKTHKRSLNANNYSWVLTGKLADKLRISKEECHRLMLERYGQTLEYSDGKRMIVSVLKDIPLDILSNSLGYIAPIKSSFLGDKEFVHYRVLKGSSEFNNEEMSIFIDGIVYECKEQGIETLTPDELEKMKRGWQNE